MRRVWSFLAIGALTVNRIQGLKFSNRLEASLVVTRLPPLYRRPIDSLSANFAGTAAALTAVA
jgi:hypothetical protein